MRVPILHSAKKQLLGETQLIFGHDFGTDRFLTCYPQNPIEITLRNPSNGKRLAN